MEYTEIIGTFKVISSGEIIEERLEIISPSDKETLLDCYKEVIADYNDVELERKKEDKRYKPDLREAIECKPITPTTIFYCDFTKQNSGTLKDNIGYYDRVKCDRCGRVKRKRHLSMKKIKCKIQNG